MKNREIEVKFLEVDKPSLTKKLKALGAQDLGEEIVTEQIFYDRNRDWIKEHKFVRIRKTGKEIYVTFKHTQRKDATGVEEIEFKITEHQKVYDFLLALGLELSREQEKQRHKFKLKAVTVDIDTWPKIPTYVELEGPSEESIQEAAAELGFEWSRGVFGTAANVIEEVYNIPVRNLKFFTFTKVE